MTVTAKIALAITALESLTSPSEAVGSISAPHSVTDKRTLNASSTPAATKAFSDQIQLSSGSYDLDLAALTDAINAALDLTGLKVQAFGITADSDNTENVAVAAHGTNGYNLLADADGKVEVAPGGSFFLVAPESAPDVGASAKVLAFTSSDVDAIVTVLIVAG